MFRIPEVLRLPLLSAFRGHWDEAEIVAGGAIELVPGFGKTQFGAACDLYIAKADEVLQLEETELPALRAERNAKFGTSATDEGGVWMRLLQYKALVRARLGSRHPLSKTVPNLGKIAAENYLTICHRFIDHWTRVNAALPAASPLVLGTFTLGALQDAHDALHAKLQAIEEIEEVTLPLTRAEKEKIFGDVPEEEREDDSLVARMMLYEAIIRARFPNDPIAVSVPEIFPPEAPSTVPTFDINWVMQPGSVLKLWFERPNVTGGALVAVQEGAVEQTQPLDAGTPGEIEVTTWNGIVVVNEIDEVEIRNGDGIAIARGVRNIALPEPVGV